MEPTVTISMKEYNKLKDRADIRHPDNIMNYLSKEYIGGERITGNRYNVVVDVDKLNKHILSFSNRCEEIKYTAATIENKELDIEEASLVAMKEFTDNLIKIMNYRAKGMIL